MTGAQIAALIGRRAQWSVADVVVTVTITDVKMNYGIVQYLVTPVAGSGATWIRATSATVEDVR